MVSLLFDHVVEQKPQFEQKKHGITEVSAPQIENRFLQALDLTKFLELTSQVKSSVPVPAANLSLHKLLSTDPVDIKDREYFDAMTMEQFPEHSDKMTIQKAFTDNYYVSYQGSETYEPFEEGVQWIVLLHRFENLQQKQIDQLKVVSGQKEGNSRTVQEINGREVHVN